MHRWNLSIGSILVDIEELYTWISSKFAKSAGKYVVQRLTTCIQFVIGDGGHLAWGLFQLVTQSGK